MPTVDSKQRLADRILFGECQKINSMPNMLTESAKTMIDAYDGKKQTPPTAPVVMINDLSKDSPAGHGTNVSATIIHDLQTLGSTGLDNRGLSHAEDVSSASMDIKIDQQHKSVRVPLGIYQQAVGYDRRKLVRPLLMRYHAKFQDEDFLYKVCGARGTYTGDGRIMPLESNPSFGKAMVEPLQAPTFRRKGYCGAADSIDGSGGGTAITANDVFKETDVRKFKQAIELMSNPLQPCRIAPSDKSEGTDPMYIGFITPKMWTTYESNATDFQKMISNALNRTRGFNHPLFQGDMFMKDNILFKKYTKPVGWQEGETVVVSDDADSATTSNQTVPAGVTVERGFILGGQALMMAYGNVLPGGIGNFKYKGKVMEEEALDMWYVGYIDWIGAAKKTRFKDASGRIEDYGTFIFDAAVP